MGINYKNDDSQRDAVMKYFSDFRENIIDNFTSQNITDYYIKLIKNYIEGNLSTSKKTTKSSTSKTKSSRVTVKEEKLSLSEIISKFL
jgi:membrane-associated HD superfamily phosphohydrolase